MRDTGCVVSRKCGVGVKCGVYGVKCGVYGVKCGVYGGKCGVCSGKFGDDGGKACPHTENRMLCDEQGECLVRNVKSKVKSLFNKIKTLG